METTSPRPTHIVLAAFPAFGHVRPVIALASSLVPLGYTVTLITGTSFRDRVEAIQGVEFVPLRGKADFDFDVPFGSATLPFDMEHVFHDGFDEQFEAIKEVIERPDLRNRPTVIVAAAGRRKKTVLSCSLEC
jgi:UDP:flavonoid glycosyltransferase YjiC (YdhE family)